MIVSLSACTATGSPRDAATAHTLVQGQVVDGREVVDPARAHERLEADDPTCGELAHRVNPAGNKAAPQRDVDQRVPLEAPALLVKRSAGDRRRVRVERHVDRRRRPAGGERPRARLKALPIGATGLVHVHVAVDNPGQKMKARGVDLLGRGTQELRTGFSDQSVGDADVEPARGAGTDHKGIADEHVEAHPTSSRNRVVASIAAATSSTVTDSAGLWLTPPAQRTNSIAIGAIVESMTAS